MSFGIVYVSGGAPENPSVVWLGTVRITDPVKLSINEIDATGFISRVQFG
jgi:hypothetical protein